MTYWSNNQQKILVIAGILYSTHKPTFYHFVILHQWKYFIRKNNKNENALYISQWYFVYQSNAKVREKSMLWLCLPISYFSYRYSLIYELLQCNIDEGWGVELWKNIFCIILHSYIPLYIHLSTSPIYILEVHLPICQYQYKSK